MDKEIPKLQGLLRRLSLPGHPIELSGDFVDGTKIDWNSYRGKVVLVDFWATWCGPCRGELPNVLDCYKKYHDKGFDVVGVSLDNKREALEKFLQEQEIPWPSLYSDDPDATGWNAPMAVYYGINSIPTTILVDQKGNVVSMEARGEKLGELLEKLLGPLPGEGASAAEATDQAEPAPEAGN